MMKNLIIYTITNTVTGEKYVGQTRRGLARRRAEHRHRFNLGERDHELYRAMVKYGFEKFKFEVVCHCLRPEYLDEMEAHFVEHFRSFDNGYNMTRGGDSISDGARANISKALKGREIWWKDKLWVNRRGQPDHKDPKDYVAKGGKHTKAKRYLVRTPEGEELVVHGLNLYCKERGLDMPTMLATLKGLQRQHKGYALLARFND